MLPTLWTFRRCPYAIRARMALHVAEIAVEHREVALRDKPAAMLAASPKGTVPVLQAGDRVIDESLDIMRWALEQNDPERWLDYLPANAGLIATNDSLFKQALDRTKYPTRYPGTDPVAARRTAADLLHPLNQRLASHTGLTGTRDTLVDIALFPFIRQFAMIDRTWFDAQPWPHLIGWLDRHLNSARFADVMAKRAAPLHTVHDAG